MIIAWQAPLGPLVLTGRNQDIARGDRMCTKNIVRISALIVIVIACLFLSYGACYAALGVEPENIELVVSPDIAMKGVYNVINEGSEAVHVKVQPENWPRSSAGDNVISVDKWLTITPMEFDLAPQERKEAQFAINPPRDHGGELSAMIFFATSSPEGAMTITTRNGVSLYAAFADSMKLECLITNVDVSRFQQKTDTGIVDQGIVFTIDFENKGNVHLRPTGSIMITGDDGSKYDINIARGFPAYPGGKGSYQVLWDKKNILPGKYRADITLDYGQLFKIDKKLYKTVSFAVNKDGGVTF